MAIVIPRREGEHYRSLSVTSREAYDDALTCARLRRKTQCVYLVSTLHKRQSRCAPRFKEIEGIGVKVLREYTVVRKYPDRQIDR